MGLDGVADGDPGGDVGGVVVEVAGAVVVGGDVCAGVEDCRWPGVDGADWAGVVCGTVPRLVPVPPLSAVDGCTDAVAGDTSWLADCDGDFLNPVAVGPWPPELVSSTATIAATPQRATPTPAAARR